MQEASYMHRLRSQFQLVEVPPDGSCLFASVGKGMAYRAEQMHLEKSRGIDHHPYQPPTSCSNPLPLTSSPLPSALPSPAAEAPPDAAMLDGPLPAKDEPPHSHSIAVPHGRRLTSAEPPRSSASALFPSPASRLPSHEWRCVSPSSCLICIASQTVHHLLTNPTFHPAIRHEVREALVQERGRARGCHLRSGPPAAAAPLWGSCHPSSSIRHSKETDALQVYASVMEKEGIYGTQLEVEALSSAPPRPHPHLLPGRDRARRGGRGAGTAAEADSSHWGAGEGTAPSVSPTTWATATTTSSCPNPLHPLSPSLSLHRLPLLLPLSPVRSCLCPCSRICLVWTMS